MSNAGMNLTVDNSVSEAVWGAVHDDARDAVCWDVTWTVEQAVFVDLAVYWAVYRALEDPEHPALQDFLWESEAQ